MILKTQSVKKVREKSVEDNGDKCPILGLTFSKESMATTPCLDHCHSLPQSGDVNAGRVREALCMNANTYLGYVERKWEKYCKKHTELSLSEVLRNIADYLEKDYSSNPMHYTEILKWRRKINRWKVDTIKKKLTEAKVDWESNPKGVLKKELVVLYVDKVVIPLYGEDPNVQM